MDMRDRLSRQTADLTPYLLSLLRIVLALLFIEPNTRRQEGFSLISRTMCVKGPGVM